MAYFVLVALAVTYSWIAAGLHPFTWPMQVMAALPILLVLVLSLREPTAGASRERLPSRAYRLGLWVWGALVALAVVWELIAYAGSPRHDHPTLSSIAELVMSTQATRALVFAAWLGAGAVLLSRRRLART